MQSKKEHRRHPCFLTKNFSTEGLIRESPPTEAFEYERQAKWKLIIAALQKCKGVWFRLQSYDKYKTASTAVTKLRKTYKGQGFEFVHYKGKLWGRYVGIDLV
ncbi:hypothetical protein A2Z53_02920 [Candidatus Giovannonibacteria bacterium RIFCSPHIGHO2_02_42_15]|uniref:Uncharacterized protein n=2 Tax=Candidatus Giovannoniibacteriota TaxID=1752738 RepID=A0A1F5VNA8_9BACT|nr:MAG: hypothetical protein UV11_C0005G0009 [Candidatus Giovannonibacteria bacterium GW2011_GWF2_42_19]OGF64894.1 MAG: hypothetical protein A2Z53_02920 [Candidatus Giovannonibacteria bacterium RIFCSPHIGHO2_02_42_15]